MPGVDVCDNSEVNWSHLGKKVPILPPPLFIPIWSRLIFLTKMRNSSFFLLLFYWLFMARYWKFPIINACILPPLFKISERVVAGYTFPTHTWWQSLKVIANFLGLVSFSLTTGVFATTCALTMGLYSFRKGQTQRSQLMMRFRVAAQAFTIGAVLVGVAIQSRKTDKPDT